MTSNAFGPVSMMFIIINYGFIYGNIMPVLNYDLHTHTHVCVCVPRNLRGKVNN